MLHIGATMEKVAVIVAFIIVMVPAVCGYLLIRSLRREAKGLERMARSMAEIRKTTPEALRPFKDVFK